MFYFFAPFMAFGFTVDIHGPDFDLQYEEHRKKEEERRLGDRYYDPKRDGDPESRNSGGSRDNDQPSNSDRQ